MLGTLTVNYSFDGSLIGRKNDRFGSKMILGWNGFAYVTTLEVESVLSSTLDWVVNYREGECDPLRIEETAGIFFDLFRRGFVVSVWLVPVAGRVNCSERPYLLDVRLRLKLLLALRPASSKVTPSRSKHFCDCFRCFQSP